MQQTLCSAEGARALDPRSVCGSEGSRNDGEHDNVRNVDDEGKEEEQIADFLPSTDDLRSHHSRESEANTRARLQRGTDFV